MTEVFRGFAFQQNRWGTEGDVVLTAGERLAESNGFLARTGCVVLCLRMTVKLKSLSALSKEEVHGFWCTKRSKSWHLIQPFSIFLSFSGSKNIWASVQRMINVTHILIRLVNWISWCWIFYFFLFITFHSTLFFSGLNGKEKKILTFVTVTDFKNPGFIERV